MSNDVSEREYQLTDLGKQWSKGKSCPTFNPLGPSLVPAAEVRDVQDLRLWSTVNAEPRQNSTTADMIFSASYQVWYLSHYLALQPGDIINTGTPRVWRSPVAFLTCVLAMFSSWASRTSASNDNTSHSNSFGWG